MPSGENLTISEAAERLSVSTDTIKRRIKRGEYADAYRQSTPQGFRWMIPVADLDLDDVAASQGNQQDASESPQGDKDKTDPSHTQATQQLIETLQRELDIRNREIERLHIVVAQQSAAIQSQASVIAALPDQVPDRPGQGASDQYVVESSDAGDDPDRPGPDQDAALGLWRRLWDAIRGRQEM